MKDVHALNWPEAFASGLFLFCLECCYVNSADGLACGHGLNGLVVGDVAGFEAPEGTDE